MKIKQLMLILFLGLAINSFAQDTLSVKGVYVHNGETESAFYYEGPNIKVWREADGRMGYYLGEPHVKTLVILPTQGGPVFEFLSDIYGHIPPPFNELTEGCKTVDNYCVDCYPKVVEEKDNSRFWCENRSSSWCAITVMH